MALGLTQLMPEDTIESEEGLYRRVPSNQGKYAIVEGRLRFSSTAFNDPGRKPSVDRAKLRNSPEETKWDPTDGVVSLVAFEVRAIKVENTEATKDDPSHYSVDIVPRPIPAGNPEQLPENMAHAQIESDPVMASGSRFRKLKEALAQIADHRGWLVEPS